MDPNATLALVRAYAERIAQYKSNNIRRDAEELAQACEALDEWLSKGGALPDAWKVK